MKKLTSAVALLLLLPTLVQVVRAASADTNAILADFSDLGRWKAELPAGAALAAGPARTARLAWKTNSAAAAHPAVLTLKLEQPAPLPHDARRAGLWLYVERPIELHGIWLALRDADGRTFHYCLAKLSPWAKGWRHIDTFAFGTNESGKLHPDVGYVRDGGSPSPRLPLTLVGLRLESRQPVNGAWLLGRFEADAVTRGDGNWRWGLNLPGEHRWQTASLLRDGEPPYLLSGYLLPEGGESRALWRVRSGFQGPVVAEGSQSLKFDAQDVAAQGQRIALGKLPAGKYEVEVSLTPVDLRAANPDAWQRLVWQADGTATWDNQSAHGGRRSLAAERRGGHGFVGWRQTVNVPGPGRYRLHLCERGDCQAEAQVAAFDGHWKNIPGGRTVRFKPSPAWQDGAVEMTFGADVKKVYVSLVAVGAGRAWFDEVALENGMADILCNGGAESGRCVTQRQFTLFVLQSPVTSQPVALPAWSVAAGETLQIPLTSSCGAAVSAALAGGTPAPQVVPGCATKWEIGDASGVIVARDEAVGSEVVRWRPPHPGIFHFCVRRMDGEVIVDEETLLVGCRTPSADLGPAQFTLRGQAATDADLFGPGKNYFTWATYEMSPSEPNFFQAFCHWADDGRAAGFNLFRVRVNWNDVEPLPGVFDFSLVDRCIAAVIERGGRVIPEIVTSNTPDWVDNQLQLDAEGRADLWVHGSLGTTITSVWTPGLLDAVRRFVDATVRHYRNNPRVVAYHLWGLPGCCDWPFVDKPWWGQVTDYSAAAQAAFRRWSQGKYAAAPLPDPDWNHPDLRPEWRAWTQFKAYGAERFVCDSVIAPLRALDDRRPVPAYYGFEFAAPRIAQSARRQDWFRHTGGCDLYYQSNMFAAEALHATGHPWPQETGDMTPLGGELELATWQASGYGGAGLNWNYYWREGIRVGQWTVARNEAVAEWQNKWAPLWRELRDARLAQEPDLAVVKTWSTMHYGLRTFFPHRLNDYCSPMAAVVYRDQLWPTWFSENCDLGFLQRQKLVIAAAGAARVMPAELADALADYVRRGGRLVLFPDSGRWVVEEPGRPGALLRRLGWTGAAAAAEAVGPEVGNSGLAASRASAREARVAPHSAALRPLDVLPMTGCARLSAAQGEVHAVYGDGSPAAISWKCGRGEVLLLAGTPEWEKATGLFQALYRWAGGRREVRGGAPSVMVNHLVKGPTHYLLVHRGPDGLSARQPTLDRALLRALPPLATEFTAGDLPPGVWRMTDLTDNACAPREVSSAELAHGLPVSLYLAETKVIRLEPLP
jgi:hypothetical protein